ncbi:MAG: hypothetical protein ABIB47_02730 [Candidatus Woesearchaeota archaeon]
MEKKNAKGITATDHLSMFIALVFFAFLLLKILPRLKFWVGDTSGWIFFIGFIIFIIKPLYKKIRKG